MLEKINLSALQDEHLVAVTAPKGLIAFRSRRIVSVPGESLRDARIACKAIALAGQYGPRLRALASIYYAREEMLAQTVEGLKAKEIAIKASQGIKDMSFRGFSKEISV